jgi:fructose-1,6-bisphosphatase/sedoheptulose 1,7-bisphosphatase-like protein
MIDARMRYGDARIEFEFVRATEAAAIAAARMVGLGDKNGVDQAAVDAMRQVLGDVDVAGTVVIGEGEKDEAPMLYIGETLGTGDGPAVDIAVDPIDGTTLASRGGAGAISVVAAARRGTLFTTRIPYMDKIVVGPPGTGRISIDRPLRENIRALAAECTGRSARSPSRCSTARATTISCAKCARSVRAFGCSRMATSRPRSSRFSRSARASTCWPASAAHPKVSSPRAP